MKSFSFQANAKPVERKNIYRDEIEGETLSYHITVDPRLVKGSAYSRNKIKQETIQPIKYKPKPIPRLIEKTDEKNFEEEEIQELLNKEPDIIEINERPIEDDIATATETFIERPPTPLLIESEKGIDVETQVGQGDLFNFDLEVRPIIKVIVQHTILRSLAEVHEEVEIENIKKHKDRFEVERNTILAELQRLEAKTQRSYEEIKRRNAQRKAVKNEIKELNRTIASRGFSEFYATDVILHAMDLLEERGMFYDEVEKEVNDLFLPWLSKEISNSINSQTFIKEIQEKTINLADNLIKNSKIDFKEEIINNKNINDLNEKNILRSLLIEDKAAENIRRALDNFEKKNIEKNQNLQNNVDNDDNNDD